MLNSSNPTTVARHSIDEEFTRKVSSRQEELIKACFGGINNGRTASFSSLFSTYVRNAGFLSVTEPNSPEIDSSLEDAGFVGAALFKVASSPPDAEVEVLLSPSLPSHFKNTLKNDLINVGDWHTAFLVAAISRNAVALDTLCQTPINLLRRSVSRTDDYYFLYAETLQALWKKQEDVDEKLLAAMEATDPDNLPEHHIDFVLHIAVPEMELLMQYLANDEEAFNTSLVQALELHKKFYGLEEKFKRNPIGFLALGPLAMCCFAVDGGMKVTVESDYLLQSALQVPDGDSTEAVPPPA